MEEQKEELVAVNERITEHSGEKAAMKKRQIRRKKTKARKIVLGKNSIFAIQCNNSVTAQLSLLGLPGH